MKTQNIPTYMNNKLINSIYATNIYDQNFYQQTQLQKEEQLRKIKNVSDLGLSKEQITEYVISPIKVEKTDANQLEVLRAECKTQFKKEYIETNWWKYRTNAPYKNILKDQNWKKNFKSNEDLIVHKYTNIDKIGLLEEYEAIMKLIENHNGELKVVFSASSENKHKEQYTYLQKTKWKKYNPKDYNDLKNYYEKEQQNINNKQKILDSVISRVMNEDMTDAELKQIETEFLEPIQETSNLPKARINKTIKNINLSDATDLVPKARIKIVRKTNT